MCTFGSYWPNKPVLILARKPFTAVGRILTAVVLHTRRVGSAPTTTDAGRPVGALARRPGVLPVHEA